MWVVYPFEVFMDCWKLLVSAGLRGCSFLLSSRGLWLGKRSTQASLGDAFVFCSCALCHTEWDRIGGLQPSLINTVYPPSSLCPFLLYLAYLFIYCCWAGPRDVCSGAHVTEHVQRSEDNFVESVFPFLLWVESREQTQVARPVC